MTQRMFNAWGKDLQRGCLVQGIAVLIVIPLFLVFIILPLFLANRPGISETQSLIIMVSGGILFLLVLFVGGGGYLFITLHRRAVWLDEAFRPFSLDGKAYNLTGRQFHGNYRGREMDVLFQRGPSLLIYLSTSLMTRLTINDPEAVIQKLAGAFNQEPLEYPQDQLIAYAHEPYWAKAFLADSTVRKMAKELIFDQHPFLIRSIEFQPGTILLRLYRSQQLMDFRFTPEQTRRWIQLLLDIVEQAERQPAPQEALAASSLSESLREGKATRWVWIILGGMAVLSLCVGLIAVIVVLTLSG